MHPLLLHTNPLSHQKNKKRNPLIPPWMNQIKKKKNYKIVLDKPKETMEEDEVHKAETIFFQQS